MLHFPAVVNAGATLNVLLTVGVTWYIEPRYPALAGVWVALVLVLNLLPVVLLRLSLRPATVYPALQDMDFFRDQRNLFACHPETDIRYLSSAFPVAVVAVKQ